MRETEGVGLQRFTVPGLDSTQWTRSKRDYAQLVFYYQDLSGRRHDCVKGASLSLPTSVYIRLPTVPQHNSYARIISPYHLLPAPFVAEAYQQIAVCISQQSCFNARTFSTVISPN